MILPQTIYITHRPVEISVTLCFNHASPRTFRVMLKAETTFRISVWNNGDEEIIKIRMDDEEIIKSLLDLGMLGDTHYDALVITIPRINIERDCELISDFSSAIYFYSAQEEYGAFSNFSNHGFEHDEIYYKTVEHYYQSEKFDDPMYRQKIIRAETPKEAADLGKSKHVSLKPDWNTLKMEVMSFAVDQKLNTHPHIRELLFSTGDRLIIENSPYDNYWGIGRNGTGKNMLGIILMRDRSLVRKAY